MSPGRAIARGTVRHYQARAPKSRTSIRIKWTPPRSPIRRLPSGGPGMTQLRGRPAVSTRRSPARSERQGPERLEQAPDCGCHQAPGRTSPKAWRSQDGNFDTPPTGHRVQARIRDPPSPTLSPGAGGLKVAFQSLHIHRWSLEVAMKRVSLRPTFRFLFLGPRTAVGLITQRSSVQIRPPQPPVGKQPPDPSGGCRFLRRR